MKKDDQKILAVAAVGAAAVLYLVTRKKKDGPSLQIGPGASSQDPAAPPMPPGIPVTPQIAPSSNSSSAGTALVRGSRGANVQALQAKLIALGYNLGSGGADGIFGNDTYKAVRKFQKDNNLGIDGIVGPNTARALAESRAA